MGILYGGSGCLLKKSGITKLSELIIDADRDWGDRGISNLGGLAAGMEKGDLLQRGASGVMERLSPGAIGNELTSLGAGRPVQWKAPPRP